MIAASRCHEFVIRMDEPFPVTVALVNAAADAIMIEMGFDPAVAQQTAMSALFAGRRHATERDTELDRVRAQNDRLRKQLARAERRFTPDDR